MHIATIFIMDGQATIRAALLLLSVGILGEKIQRMQIVACLLGMVGIALLVFQPTARLNMLGIFAGLAGAVSMATVIVLAKRWNHKQKVGIFNFTGW